MMGGELWAVQLASKTMMVCGIDIYHDPDPGRPTVVGFVASTNATVTRWYSRAKFVEQGDDMVGTIKICLIECLRKYFEVIINCYNFSSPSTNNLCLYLD